MLGGLLIDLLVVAAVVAFAWAGRELGAIASIGRAVASGSAFAAAALLRDPLGAVVRSIFGTSVDLSRLVAMLVVGIATYLAATRVLAWWRSRQADGARPDGGEEGATGEDDVEGSVAAAAVAGGALGLAWALVFVSMLVLLPASTYVSRAAAGSITGGATIRQEGALRWLRSGFPHYTQTLPKGSDGAVVGERDRIDLHGEVVPREATRDGEVVLAGINRSRRSRSVRALAFNPDVAKVAQRHAESLAAEETLSYRPPAGGALDGRVQAALGESAAAFRPEAGIEVAWAHGPANAVQAMLRDDRGGPLLRDARWSEVGIGIADAGWFNGRIYVVVLVGAADDATAPGAAGQESAGASDPFTGTPEDVPAGAAEPEGPVPQARPEPGSTPPEDPVFD